MTIIENIIIVALYFGIPLGYSIWKDPSWRKGYYKNGPTKPTL